MNGFAFRGFDPNAAGPNAAGPNAAGPTAGPPVGVTRIIGRRWVLTAACWAVTVTVMADPPERPNFVLFLVDDLGVHDVGIEGSRLHQTPNIDALARRSVRFDRAYSASRVCSPSRVAIQTGRHPARTGITNNIGVLRFHTSG